MTFICVLARITRTDLLVLIYRIMFHTISTQVYSSLFTLTRPSTALAASESLGTRLAMMFTLLSCVLVLRVWERD